jgi:hypothetical protein
MPQAARVDLVDIQRSALLRRRVLNGAALDFDSNVPQRRNPGNGSNIGQWRLRARR